MKCLLKKKKTQATQTATQPQVKMLIHKGNINQQPSNITSAPPSPNSLQNQQNLNSLQNQHNNQNWLKTLLHQTWSEKGQIYSSSGELIRLLTAYKSKELWYRHRVSPTKALSIGSKISRQKWKQRSWWKYSLSLT